MSSRPPSLMLFVALMLVVIAVQGTYLGYVVGMLTTLEKRFGISSEPTGSLLSMYDIGHTIAILLVGYLWENGHHPKIAGVGVILSSLSMFVLFLPVLLFGAASEEDALLQNAANIYAGMNKCGSDWRDQFNQDKLCRTENKKHVYAYWILAVGQFLAGVFSAPFNTLSYVYIDNNLDDRRKSPFLLSLLTAMSAFAPAIGLGLSTLLNRVYTTLGRAPGNLHIHDEEWIGAWWLGFLICGVAYLLLAAPFFFFPRSYRIEGNEYEMKALKEKKPHLPPATFQDEENQPCCKRLRKSFKEYLLTVYDLLRNPVFVSMALAWTFGSYLISGYNTYLPKYLEKQFGQSASIADLCTAGISVGAIATSTLLGGWILTRINIKPRIAILLLAVTWAIVGVTYVIGMTIHCPQPPLEGLYETTDSWELSAELSCSRGCGCSSVLVYDPVNFDGSNFYSACQAGCQHYRENMWTNCSCSGGAGAFRGLARNSECASYKSFAYLAIMFVGLFIGNLFFITTMMIVLRSVYDDQKVAALSVASCVTNLFGFVPAPMLFGWIIDSTCILWHSRCKNAGNCVLYDNSALRYWFHSANAALQLLACACVAACYLVARRRKFPEEEAVDEEVYEEVEANQQ